MIIPIVDVRLYKLYLYAQNTNHFEDDGKMRTTREASLEQFRKNPSIQVLIMSLQCGNDVFHMVL